MDTFDLSKVPPEEKFAEIEKFKNKLQENFVAFGELLSDIKRTGVFKFKGYKTFKEFIEKEYNLASSFASKLIDTYELFMEEMDIDEETLKEIGFDRLNMIKPLVKDCEINIAEEWIEDAKRLSTPDLRERVKEEKERNKKPESFKDILIKQHLEKMCVHFNCSVKELNYKMAIYFQDADLDSIKIQIKEKQRRFEESGDFDGMNK
ncbi:MAG: hypothetical protein PHY08_03795 [Candidatus Cloacimonetes bacterium]|jgi:hypothetical protein|nr:hypothetical protein [Candidatus Cloacimonadota bacterium]MDD4155675.1 hypothetical protein [Candidatus Cloacimonadota bacterium]